MEKDNSFGERLRNLRVEMGYSQAEFAKLLGICKQTIYIYENGYSEPSLSKLITIATKCKVSLDWLCGLSINQDITTSTQQLVSFYRYLDSTEEDHQIMQKYLKKYM